MTFATFFSKNNCYRMKKNTKNRQTNVAKGTKDTKLLEKRKTMKKLK